MKLKLISLPTLTNYSILEIWVGSKLLGVICKELLHYNYESIDIDNELKPDHVGSVLEMPFSNKKFDIVVCFQVLEHLPYENFEKALSELFRVAKNSVIISLPNTKRVLPINILKICERKLVNWPFTIAKKHNFNCISGHYWEINKKNYEINKVINNIIEIGRRNNFILKKDYRVWENS